MNPSTSTQLTNLILTVFQLNGRLLDWGNEFSARHGLTSARWQILGAIALSERAPTAPQLAAFMGITRQGAQKQLKLLQQGGLIQAEQNRLHKRSPVFTLTPQGRQAFNAIDTQWNAHAAQLAAGFSRDQLHTAHAVLTSLIQHHQPQDTTP